MKNENTGGSPYPPYFQEAVNEGQLTTPQKGGMTVLDYFAAQSLAGLRADPDCDLSSVDAAELAYADARAMMEERLK